MEPPAGRNGGKVLAGFALLVGFIITVVLWTDDGRTSGPVRHENPALDALAWIPATDQTVRSFAAWAAEPGDPLNAVEALDRIDPEPAPLILGRSDEWQAITGTSASDFNAWASAGTSGPTVLVGAFDATLVTSALRSAGYTDVHDHLATIWLAPVGMAPSQIVNGDDLRALAAIAVTSDRIIVGLSEESVALGLRAGNGLSPSLADAAQDLPVSGFTAGLMVVDQRDLAIQCGVGALWNEIDFSSSSGFKTWILWNRGSTPQTTVGVQYADELAALAGLSALEPDWRSGFLNGRGLGAAVSDLATVEAVYPDGTWVVADLSNGRENGWTRSGVRFLVGICEEASRLIPPGSPVLASPEASPASTE